MSHSGPLDYWHADTQRLENSAHSAIQEDSHLTIFESQLFLDFCSCYEIVSDLLLFDCVFEFAFCVDSCLILLFTSE